jgi:hypothetical protein
VMIVIFHIAFKSIKVQRTFMFAVSLFKLWLKLSSLRLMVFAFLFVLNKRIVVFHYRAVVMRKIQMMLTVFQKIGVAVKILNFGLEIVDWILIMKINMFGFFFYFLCFGLISIRVCSFDLKGGWAWLLFRVLFCFKFSIFFLKCSHFVIILSFVFLILRVHIIIDLFAWIKCRSDWIVLLIKIANITLIL